MDITICPYCGSHCQQNYSHVCGSSPCLRCEGIHPSELRYKYSTTTPALNETKDLCIQTLRMELQALSLTLMAAQQQESIRLMGVKKDLEIYVRQLFQSAASGVCANCLGPVPPDYICQNCRKLHDGTH